MEIAMTKSKRMYPLPVLMAAFVGCVPLNGDPQEPFRPLNQNVPEEETIPFRHCVRDDDCVYVLNDCKPTAGAGELIRSAVEGLGIMA